MPSATIRPRVWRRLGLGGLVGASVLVALVVCELVARGIGWAPRVYRLTLETRQSAYRISDDPILGYELKRNWRDDAADLNNSYPYTNADGERDVEHAVDKPPAVRRIVVLGDSVVVGLGLRDLDDLIARRLQALLDPQRFEVLSFGAKGYNTRGEVRLLETKALRYAPDLVIVVFLDNDLVAYDQFDAEQPYVYQRPALANMLFVRSVVFRRLALEWNLFHFRLELDPEFRDARQRSVASSSVDGAVRRLAELAHTHGFRTLLLAWPWFTDGGFLDEKVPLVHDGSGDLLIEQIARAHSIPSARFSDYFRRDYAKRVRAAAGRPVPTPRTLYSFDEMHANPIGTRVAAAAIREVMDANPELLGGGADGPPAP